MCGTQKIWAGWLVWLFRAISPKLLWKYDIYDRLKQVAGARFSDYTAFLCLLLYTSNDQPKKYQFLLLLICKHLFHSFEISIIKLVWVDLYCFTYWLWFREDLPLVSWRCWCLLLLHHRFSIFDTEVCVICKRCVHVCFRSTLHFYLFAVIFYYECQLILVTCIFRASLSLFLALLIISPAKNLAQINIYIESLRINSWHWITVWRNNRIWYLWTCTKSRQSIYAKWTNRSSRKNNNTNRIKCH